MAAFSSRRMVRGAAGIGILAALCLFDLVDSAWSREQVPARVTLLRNQEYADALVNGIREARREIIFSFYLFKMTDARSNLPRRIADELIKARQRGVSVSVILETSSRNDPLNADNHATASYLSKRGVRVYFDSPTVTTHAKAAVMDGRLVFLGSHNLTQSALAHNNELSVLIDSPELAAEIKSWLDRL